MKRNKVLFVATITKHILRFHLPFLKWFQENGFETHVAANGNEEIPFCDVIHNIPIQRSPFSPKNIKATKALKEIIKTNDFSLIHGHTPMGGLLSRVASINSRRNGTKVLYTAHGFHFFKGAPIKNWVFYYPVEKFLSKYTDGIITINQEDYQLLYEKNFKSPGKYLISGMGVNDERFHPVTLSEKVQIRHELGYSKDMLILIYVAEFIHRKNHMFIIDATSDLVKKIPNLKIIFAGRGLLLEKMKKYVEKLGLSGIIDFMGFRSDVNMLMAMSDIGISSSRQEGLGLNLAEEMLVGLPVVATKDRGHLELIRPEFNGFLFDQNDKEQFINFVVKLAENKELRSLAGRNSVKIAQKFTLSNSFSEMVKIYKNYID